MLACKSKQKHKLFKKKKKMACRYKKNYNVKYTNAIMVNAQTQNVEIHIKTRIRWQDKITNEEVRRRFGVENPEHRLKKIRLGWFGHVKRRDENSILRRAMELEKKGRRPVRRPKKTRSKVVEEDTRY